MSCHLSEIEALYYHTVQNSLDVFTIVPQFVFNQSSFCVVALQCELLGNGLNIKHWTECRTEPSITGYWLRKMSTDCGTSAIIFKPTIRD